MKMVRRKLGGRVDETLRRPARLVKRQPVSVRALASGALDEATS